VVWISLLLEMGNDDGGGSSDWLRLVHSRLAVEKVSDLIADDTVDEDAVAFAIIQFFTTVRFDEIRTNQSIPVVIAEAFRGI
jgi:hypothetical protein